MSFDENEEEEPVIGDIPSDSDSGSVYFDAVENDPTSTAAVSFRINPTVPSTPSKPRTIAEKIKAAKVELQFPDEV